MDRASACVSMRDIEYSRMAHSPKEVAQWSLCLAVLSPSCEGHAMGDKSPKAKSKGDKQKKVQEQKASADAKAKRDKQGQQSAAKK